MFAPQTTSGINSDVFPETIVHKIWSLFNQWFYDTCVGVLQLSVFRSPEEELDAALKT